MSQPDARTVDQIRAVAFLSDNDVIQSLKDELPTYIVKASQEKNDIPEKLRKFSKNLEQIWEKFRYFDENFQKEV